MTPTGWICPKCGALNGGLEKRCLCGHAKPVTIDDILDEGEPLLPPPHQHNWAALRPGYEVCDWCGAVKRSR